MRFRVATAVLAFVAACNKRTPAPSPAPAPSSTAEEIQCWRRSGMKPPGERLAIAKALLAKGAMRVYLDSKAPGVVLPPERASDIRTILVVGYDLPKPIPDLKVDETGVSGTLSFHETPFFVKVPWPAVFALTTNDEGQASGGVWEESVPKALFCKE